MHAKISSMKLVIVTPVFNDWDSLDRLLSDIDITLKEKAVDYSVLIVNDDSGTEPPTTVDSTVTCNILHLTCNLGHQRAIAMGLAQLADTYDFDAAIVMDSPPQPSGNLILVS